MKNLHYLFNYATSETEFEGTHEECYQYAVDSGFIHEVGCLGSGREPGDLLDDFSILELYDLEQNIPTTGTDVKFFTVKTYALGRYEKQSGYHLYTIRAVYWQDDNSFDHEFGSEGGVIEDFDFDLNGIFAFDWAEEETKDWLSEQCRKFVKFRDLPEIIDLTA